MHEQCEEIDRIDKDRTKYAKQIEELNIKIQNYATEIQLLQNVFSYFAIV